MLAAISAQRSSTEKKPGLVGCRPTPTITRSNSRRARSTISTCPSVIGSKEPGYTAVSGRDGSGKSRTAGSFTVRSIIPTMPRLAPAGAWILALATLACACSTPPPPPSKLAEAESPIQEAALPKSEVESPFRPPNKEPPLPRSAPQLPPEELAAALNRADEARKIGDNVNLAAALRSCANKIPQNVRCEGELGALLASSPRFKYEADYYLDEAVAAADDPALDAAYYRRLGQALRDKGRFADAAVAYQRMIDRSTPASAEDYNLLATVLQGAPDRLYEAAEALRRAYELDPTRIEWVRDQAILLGQTPDKLPRAIELFEEFKSRTRDPDLLAETDRRIGELKYQLERLGAADPGATAPKKKGKKAAKKKPAAGSK
jgi:tetratricopeptide (TPR) repeat protein